MKRFYFDGSFIIMLRITVVNNIFILLENFCRFSLFLKKTLIYFNIFLSKAKKIVGIYFILPPILVEYKTGNSKSTTFWQMFICSINDSIKSLLFCNLIQHFIINCLSGINLIRFINIRCTSSSISLCHAIKQVHIFKGGGGVGRLYLLYSDFDYGKVSL